MKKKLNKMGIEDPINDLKNSFKRTDYGICITIAGGVMYAIVFFILFGLALLFTTCVIKSDAIPAIKFISLLFLCFSFIINHFLLFKEDKYLDYFKKIERMKKEKKQRWAWISYLVVIFILFFIVGCYAMFAYKL